MSNIDPAIIGKIIQKTRSGSIKWSKYDPQTGDFSNMVISEAYRAEYNGERLQLFLESRVDEEGDVNIHRSRLRLFLVEENGDLIWEFPSLSAIDDLLSTIRFQVGNVKDRLKRLSE